MKKPILALALLTGVLLLQGCAAVVVGGAAGTAKASGDRRTLGAQWDDQTIELKAANLLADNKPPERRQQDQCLQQQRPCAAGGSDTL